MAIVLLFTLLFSHQLLADVPNTFQPGDTILSSEINANFEALNTRIDVLETQSQNTSASTSVTIHGATSVSGRVMNTGPVSIAECHQACINAYGSNARACNSKQLMDNMTPSNVGETLGDYYVLFPDILAATTNGTTNNNLRMIDITGMVHLQSTDGVFLNIYEYDGLIYREFRTSIANSTTSPLKVFCCSE